MVGFVKILFLDLYLHHHFHRRSHVLSVVVAFECFLEAEERIYYFTLVVEDEPLEVVGSG